jgi:hypothetical protein
MSGYMLATADLDQAAVLQEIADERARQDAKWGPIQDHANIHPGWKNFNYGLMTANNAKAVTDRRMASGDDTWTDILYEEFAEAIEEAAAGDVAALRTELIQVAAVAVKWVENLDRENNRYGVA